LTSRRFPAYYLGRKPDTKVVVTTYSGDLAGRLNRQIQRIIDDDYYKKVFPHVHLSSKDYREVNSVRNSDEFDIVGHKGSLKSVGIGGGLTGNPMDLGIIDDPVKDDAEGQSKTVQNSIWEWYNAVFKLRTHNNTKLLMTMTRWNENDLAGKILSSEPDWTVLTLPYIKEDNENKEDIRKINQVLWPEKHSLEKALEVKKNSERTFASLLQQRPAPLEGGIFKKSWWQFYTRSSMPMYFDRLITSWDCTFKATNTSDYVVGLVLAKKGADTYLIDRVRGRWDFPETIKRMRNMHSQYPMASQKFIEDKASGSAALQSLKHEIPGLIGVNPTESKESRANAVSGIVEAGNVYLPSDAPWINEFLYEVSSFPNAQHDDQVDALTQGLSKLYNFTGGFMAHIQG
jgi:predicted phage terminase large subunit-like protein